MSWKITFFNQKVEAETLALPSGILANLLHIMEMIEEFGPNIGKPYTAPMGNSLFEIRAKGKEGSRTCSILRRKRQGDYHLAFIHQKDTENTET